MAAEAAFDVAAPTMPPPPEEVPEPVRAEPAFDVAAPAMPPLPEEVPDPDAERPVWDEALPVIIEELPVIDPVIDEALPVIDAEPDPVWPRALPTRLVAADSTAEVTPPRIPPLED